MAKAKTAKKAEKQGNDETKLSPTPAAEPVGLDVMVKGADLLAGLKRVKEVVAVKQTLPVISCVLLRATDDGRLTLAGTDLEQGMTVTIPAAVEQSRAAAAVSVSRLLELAKELGEADVTLRKPDGTDGLDVTVAGAKWRLVGLPTDDMPPIAPGPENPVAVTVQPEAFVTAIEQTLYAAGEDESRPFLMGLHLTVGDPQGQLQATDGHRLVQLRLPLAPDLKDRRTAIVPTEACKVLRHLLRGVEEPVTIQLGTNQLAVTTPDATYYTRLQEGSFPDTNKVLEPAMNGKFRVECDVATLAQAVRRAALVCGVTKVVRFAFGPEGCTVSAAEQEVGEATLTLPVQWEGEPLTIGFNARYLLEYLETIGVPTVEWRMNDPMAAGLFMAKGAPLYAVMPMRA